MQKIFLTLVTCLVCMLGFAQQPTHLDTMRMKKDSSLRAAIHADSVKFDKEFTEAMKWEHLKTITLYPAIKGGDFSGVIPVSDPTEIPDPNQEYKLLFELTSNNPDSLAKELNNGLVEVSRVINLHVASGVPLKKIIPVIVVHAGALHAFCNNNHYQKKYKMDNPNIKLLGDLKAIGARFIACGQAMAFLDITRDELLPDVKVSITAQTALTNYQLKGFVKNSIQ